MKKLHKISVDYTLVRKDEMKKFALCRLENLAYLSREFLQPGEISFSKIHCSMLPALFKVPDCGWGVEKSRFIWK